MGRHSAVARNTRSYNACAALWEAMYAASASRAVWARYMQQPPADALCRT